MNPSFTARAPKPGGLHVKDVVMWTGLLKIFSMEAAGRVLRDVCCTRGNLQWLCHHADWKNEAGTTRSHSPPFHVTDVAFSAEGYYGDEISEDSSARQDSEEPSDNSFLLPKRSFKIISIISAVTLTADITDLKDLIPPLHWLKSGHY